MLWMETSGKTDWFTGRTQDGLEAELALQLAS
jgi:hypothetical protein